MTPPTKRRLVLSAILVPLALLVAGYLIWHVLKEPPRLISECQPASRSDRDAYRDGLGTFALGAALILAGLIALLARNLTRLRGREPERFTPTNVMLGVVLLTGVACALWNTLFEYIGLTALAAGLAGGELAFGWFAFHAVRWSARGRADDVFACIRATRAALVTTWLTLVIGIPVLVVAFAGEGDLFVCL